jgi:hypothetical protein
MRNTNLCLQSLAVFVFDLGERLAKLLSGLFADAYFQHRVLRLSINQLRDSV